MKLRLLILVLIATPAYGQNAGGGSDLLMQWDGQAANDSFGSSASAAGDINGDGYADVIVGASFADPGARSNAGSVFVYSGADGSLLFQWDGKNANDNFGSSVAAAGDVNNDGIDDLIIGASNAFAGGQSKAGRAYVYSGADGTQIYQWIGGNADDRFGGAVAGANDVNGDGFDDLLVGSSFADSGNGQGRSGMVVVFSGATGAVLYQWGGENVGDTFGRRLANAGDTNGDGIADILVGADSWDGPGVGGSNTGAAYLYSGATGVLLYRLDGASGNDGFGLATAGAGDLNADGFADLIVGARYADPGGASMAGSAYAYSGIDGSLLYQWDGDADYDSCGSSVFAAGDLNLDGYDDLLVGASGTDPGALTNAGSIYLYSGANGSLLWRWNGQADIDHLGDSVALAGDVTNNGQSEFLFGVGAADPGGLSNAGSVYVYDFHPFLNADTDTVSAAAGGAVNLSLSFPIAAAFDEYKVLISATGIGPTFYGVDIPLTQDSLVIETFFGNYPVASASMHGVLDSDGKGSANLNVPARIPSSLIGNTYYLAAIANLPGQLPEFSSVAVSVSIIP
jgi:FG-GAP repeat protein